MDSARPSTGNGFTVLPLGDAAITVEFGRTISPELNERALAFAQAVRLRQWKGVLDIVPAYASVSIHVDPLALPISALSERLRNVSWGCEHSPVRPDTPHPRAVWGRVRSGSS
jgi:hypothetical protein